MTESTPLAKSSRPTLELAPDPSVYGAIIFLPGVSELTEGWMWNRPAKLAVFLCILNALLQMGVVQVISVYDHAGRLENQRSLLPSDEVIEEGPNVLTKGMKDSADDSRHRQAEIHKTFLPPNEKAELEAVYDIEPLCKRIGDGNGTFTCMPHSVKFAFEWKNLDTNGDGIWTREEAIADKANLREKRRVSPESIFNNVINGLRMQQAYTRDSGRKILYLSPEVKHQKGIQKAYFDYWKGDAMMCGLFDPNSCEAAAKQGVFTPALVPGRLSPQAKGIYNLETAIQYCIRMLQDGGGCETLLPTDFRRNREQRWSRCGSRSLAEGGKYTNPYIHNQSVHVLEATYDAVGRYERATSRLYLFFLSLIIMLWLLSLIDEWRELIKLGEFLIQFPSLGFNDRPGEVIKPADENAEPTYKITGTTFVHKAILCVVFVVRVLVATVLSQFGTRFLLAETDYLSLVMNSLALTFILTIDSMLFDLLEQDTKKALDQCTPLIFETRLPTTGMAGYALKKECWGLIAVPILSVIMVLIHNYQQKEPILTVLKCACTQEGSKCLDSTTYTGAWWTEYWSKTLPAAMHQIEALRIAAAQLAGSPAAAPSPAF